MPIDTSSYADSGTNRLLATASNDPTQALATAAGVQQLGLNQQIMAIRGAQLSQTQLDLAQKKLGALNGVLGGVVANPTAENFSSQLGYATQAGVIDSDTAKKAAADVMMMGGDPDKIKQWALDHLNQNANHQQLLDQAYGSSGTVNTGGSIVPVITKTGAQAGTTVGGGAPISNTLNPGQKTGQVQYVDPSTGAGKSAPLGTLFNDDGTPRGAGYSVSPFGAVARGDAPTGQGGGAPPAGQAGQGGGAAPLQAAPISFGGAPQGGAPGSAPQAGQGTGQSQAAAGGQSGMVTPTAQNMPVVTEAQATAAMQRQQAGTATAADRNLMRGYLIQNNLPLTAKGARFEPQPATPGATVPPQPAAGGATPPKATGASAPPAGMAVQPGSDGSHLVRIAPSPDSPFAGSAPAAAPSPAGAGGVLTTSLSPGQSASIAAGANSYGALSTDASNPAGVNQRVFQLQTALNALRGTSTGLGTSGRQQLVGYLSSLPGGLAKNLPGVDANSATDYDIATKYLNAYALNTPGAARSDAGLSTAQSANANTSGMMQKAAQDVTLSNIGLEKGKLALLNSFNATGADPGTFGKFAAGWSQGNDPRAFALGDMTPPERAALFNSLQGSQKAAFLSTVKKGLSAGVLTRNDLQGAAAGNGN